MILVGVAQLKVEKLYWGKNHDIWIVSDNPDTTVGHVFTANCSEMTMCEAIQSFTEVFPWSGRVVWYVKQIERADERGWTEIANNYEKMLNENYNVYTFAGESLR